MDRATAGLFGDADGFGLGADASAAIFRLACCSFCRVWKPQQQCVCGWSRAFEDFGMPLFGPQSSGCASATTWLSLAASKLVGLQAVDAVSFFQGSYCADHAAVQIRLFV